MKNPPRNALVTEAELRRILAEEDGDPEGAHANADRALCNLLRVLGYREVVELYEQIPKWYA